MKPRRSANSGTPSRRVVGAKPASSAATSASAIAARSVAGCRPRTRVLTRVILSLSAFFTRVELGAGVPPPRTSASAASRGSTIERSVWSTEVTMTSCSMARVAATVRMLGSARLSLGHSLLK